MKVSKIIIFSLVFLLNTSAYAQKSNVNTASKALKNGNIEEAIKYIELAAANSKTVNEPRMLIIEAKSIMKFILMLIIKLWIQWQLLNVLKVGLLYIKIQKQKNGLMITN